MCRVAYRADRRHNRPISAQFQGPELVGFGEDFREAVGEPVEAGSHGSARQGATEHLEHMLGAEENRSRRRGPAGGDVLASLAGE